MLPFPLILSAALAAVVVTANGAEARQETTSPVKIPGLVTIQGGAVRCVPPAWAVMQRRLIRAMNEAAPLYLERFTSRGGEMTLHGKLDDDYECFNSWPLFYAIGGGEEILDRSLEEWSAITRQWSLRYQKSVLKEFVAQNDMLHLSEGYLGFQYFGLADPSLTENVERARRFAGFYLGEDPDVLDWDPARRIIRSPITGSAGPATGSSCDYVLIYGHASLFPVVKTLEPGWEKNPARHAEIQKLYNEIVISGDVPMNLAVTGLVSHAYILTGDEKYRKWVLEYVDAWMERTKKNNGIIPDNTGPDGIVGEKRNGQWWGGFFGWSGRYSVEMIFNSLITASECACILSGDPKYLGFLRSQVDMLLERSVVRDGNLLVPYKAGPEGWYDYRPFGDYIFSHLWKASMDMSDWDRVERIRNGKRNGPWEYAYADSPNPPPSPEAEMWRPDSTLFDWNRVLSDLRGNQHRRNEAPHLGWLAGANPDWPEKILAAEYENVALALERIRSGSWEHEWKSQTVLLQNPIFTNGLAQMTMGAPFTCYNGGLLMARVRYFDPDRARPGLPEDTAALVEKLSADRTVFSLVNTNLRETRRMIVQGGAYAEHTFTEVRVLRSAARQDSPPVPGGQVYSVNREFFAVELPPSSMVRLDADMKRFVNRPTYAFPWKRAR
ncbi:MAG: hypothetical protein Q8O92_09035 [Candidatus Latescibacter sp.]|nr:hypothetical protein [Candidatus Latescibacter sp.]